MAAARAWIRACVRFDQPLGALWLATLLVAGLSLHSLCANVFAWKPLTTTLLQEETCITCDVVTSRCFWGQENHRCSGEWKKSQPCRPCSAFQVDWSGKQIRHVYPFHPSLCLTTVSATKTNVSATKPADDCAKVLPLLQEALSRGSASARRTAREAAMRAAEIARRSKLALVPCPEAEHFVATAQGDLAMGQWQFKQAPSVAVDPVCVLQLVQATLTAAFVLHLKREAFAPASDGDELVVEVTSMSGRSCTLRMHTLQLVQDVKEEVAEAWQVPLERQCMLSGGVELPNTVSLGNFKGMLELTLVVVGDEKSLRHRDSAHERPARTVDEVPDRIRYVLKKDSRLARAHRALSGIILCFGYPYGTAILHSRGGRLLDAAFNTAVFWHPVSALNINATVQVGFGCVVIAVVYVVVSCFWVAKTFNVGDTLFRDDEAFLFLIVYRYFSIFPTFFIAIDVLSRCLGREWDLTGIRRGWWNDEVVVSDLLFTVTAPFAYCLHVGDFVTRSAMRRGITGSPFGTVRIWVAACRLRWPLYQPVALVAPEVLGRSQD